MRRFLLFPLIAFLLIASTDQGLRLIHADKSVGTKQSNERIRMFTGMVHFQQDTLNMFCDQAVFYDEQNRVEFIGNVLIDAGNKRIRALKIDYYPDSRLAVCTGRVRIRTANDSLYSEYFSYNFKTERAVAETDIYILDRTNQVQIWGEKGISEPQRKLSRIRQKARLMRIDTTANDTLHITSRIMEYHKTDDPFALAIDSVIIHQGKLTARCDTAIYFPNKHEIILRKHPDAEYEDNRLLGNKMTVLLDSMRLRQIFISDQARALSLADSITGDENILKGKLIRFDIYHNQPRQIRSVGNASSIYYLKNEEEKQGVNFATADTIDIFFKEGKVDSIHIQGGVQGIYYPQNYKGEKKFEE